MKIGRASEPQADAEEVFVADSDDGAATPGNAGAVWMDVYWPQAGHLFVAHAAKARVFKQRPSAKAAIIDYRATDPWSPLPPSEMIH